MPSNYSISCIESENQVVGFVGIIEITENSVYLVGLYPHHSCQRNEVGRFALDELVQRYKSEGFDEIVLLVHEGATWAKSFYLKNQYEFISSTENEVVEYRNGL